MLVTILIGVGEGSDAVLPEAERRLRQLGPCALAASADAAASAFAKTLAGRLQADLIDLEPDLRARERDGVLVAAGQASEGGRIPVLVVPMENLQALVSSALGLPGGRDQIATAAASIAVFESPRATSLRLAMLDPLDTLLGVGRRVAVVRHAEAPTFGGDGRVRSDGELSLTEAGLAQAAALREPLRELQAVVARCSPQLRAAETAAELAGEREVVADARLRELSLGELDGAAAERIFEACPDFGRDPLARLPGGESMSDVAKRVAGLLDQVRAEADDAILVAHGGTNRALLAEITGAPLTRAWATRIDWASINLFEQWEERWRVRALNWTRAGASAIVGSERLPGGLLDEQWRRLGR